MELKNIIPGYDKALSEERRVRELAYLPVTDYELNGIPLVPLTLERFVILEHSGNAFLCGGKIMASDIGLLIWICSPQFDPRAAKTKEQQKEKLRIYRATACLKYAATVKKLEQYLDEMFMDMPGGGSSSDKSPDIASFLASLVDTFGVEYGWTFDQVMQTPIPVLSQQLRKILKRRNPKAIFINKKSDQIRSEFLKELNGANS